MQSVSVFLMQLISGEKTLMSPEIKGCPTGFI